MEEKLFWISMVSGAYGLCLKRFMDSKARAQWKAVAAMHGLFWSLTFLVATLLWVSYKELRWPGWPAWLGIAALGAAAGVALRAWRPKTPAVSDEILRDNLEWADTGFSAILLAAFIMYFFIQAFKIP